MQAAKELRGGLRWEANATIPTRWGSFRVVVFRDAAERSVEHVALVRGDVAGDGVLCRVHSECLAGDVLGSIRCECGVELEAALGRIAAEDRGLVLYLRRARSGSPADAVHRTRHLGPTSGDASHRADGEGLGGWEQARDDGAAVAAMLEMLGVRSLRLLTNNPAKLAGLRQHGVRACRVPLDVAPAAPGPGAV